MRSIRVNLPQPVKATVRGDFLGVKEAVNGRLLAVESYAGFSPTFTWMSDTGHLFTFLPPHAFGVEMSDLRSCIDMVCPSGSIDVSDLALEGPGHGKIGDKIVGWKRYIATIDWHEQNSLCHLVQDAGGRFLFIRNARFQVGGSAYDPPSWKKLRQIWTLDDLRPAG